MTSLIQHVESNQKLGAPCLAFETWEHRLFVFGQRVSIPDKDRVGDRYAGTELTYESVT